MSTKERIKKFSKKTLDKCIPYIKIKDYAESIRISTEEAMDNLIYGIQAEKLEKGKIIDVIIYVSDYNQTDLIILEKQNNKSETLDLKMLIDISFYLKEIKFKNYFKNIKYNNNINEIHNEKNDKINNSKKRFSCFGGKTNTKGKEINNKNIKFHKEKSKKISCLGGNNSNKNGEQKSLKNNNNNNINHSLISNSSIENKDLKQFNINSSNTHNTIPDNNTDLNTNTNLNSKGENHLNEQSQYASPSKRFVSLIISVSEKINLLFKSEQELKIFALGLYQIYQAEYNQAEEKPNLNVFEKYLKKIWNKFDLNMTNFMDLPDFLRMIKLMDQNYNCLFSVNLKEDRAIKNLFEKLDKENIGKINFEEFYKFYNEIIAGSEFEEVFLNYSKGKQHMNFDDLSQFMLSEQKQIMKSDEIAEIFLEHKIEVPETHRNNKLLESKENKSKLNNGKSFEKDQTESDAVKRNVNKNIEYKLNLMEFKNFISDKNRFNIFNFDAFEVAHDMSHPLNDYFIFSSHNTFLNKNIYGEGSLEMYNFAINEGCRMLELECYDGESEPKICKSTMINEVLLKDALLNLRENSFKNINFPVLISLENYCKKEQQIILAQYLRDILKDIYTINNNKLPDKYPSPKELEGKFIIKELKIFEISRKSSLPIRNVGNFIKKTDTEYNLNFEINENSKDLSNSYSQSNILINKEADEELLQFLSFYNLDFSKRNEDLFDYEAFEDIPEENIHHPYFLKSYSILERKLERSDEHISLSQMKLDNLKKINTYGHIVINEWIDQSNQNISNTGINPGGVNIGLSIINTNKALTKCNTMTIHDKSSKLNQNKSINVFNLNNNNNKHDESNEEEDKLLSANRANNAQRKKLLTSFLSEIKEKEDDYESTYKKHCRSGDSDGLTLNRINSKFSDSNIYNNKNINSDSSNRLNSLHFSMDKHMDLSSQNRSSNNRSSKKQVNSVSYVIGNNNSGGQNILRDNNNISNDSNNNTIISGNLISTTNNVNNNNNVLITNNIPNTNFFTGSNIIINNHNVNINLNTSISNNNTYNNNSPQNNNNASNTAINLISQNAAGNPSSSIPNNISLLNHSKTFANERQQQQKQKVDDFSITIKEMQDLAGLVKKRFYLTKLDDELYYNPWDCPAIRESELQDIFKNFHLRNKLVKFCQNTFLKVQPNKTSKISTINFDPVKAWICGIQIAAINIQSLEDDFVLINKIFFKFNKGCGYVLKPEFLRNPHGTYDRFYLKPLLKVKIDIISCIMLQTCVRNFNKHENIFFESYLVGSWEDDKMNPKYKSKSYEKNLINLVFDNESIKFDVYEPELCFWMIKIYLSNNVIARSCVPIRIMNEGIRVVPLFDLNCSEFSDCVLLARIVKKAFAD